ncbi:hypothetical protein EJ04DRAFT_515721 [Polyplosphaeria fusca]|uniref:Secreted protein n=1 Tax=Polyplosphaeria fusca TaxID=682080 RepID=A0A9P4QLS2_9PLEO|nr:hypothetical protein EJ04DRAFT_515721 [Polyplosphaeria fusca]
MAMLKLVLTLGARWLDRLPSAVAVLPVPVNLGTAPNLRPDTKGPLDILLISRALMRLTQPHILRYNTHGCIS